MIFAGGQMAMGMKMTPVKQMGGEEELENNQKILKLLKNQKVEPWAMLVVTLKKSQLEIFYPAGEDTRKYSGA